MGTSASSLQVLELPIKTFTLARLHTHADLAGAAASTVCLLHCLLTPLLIGFFPGFVQYLPGDAPVHRLLAVAVLLLGTAAFVPGYRLHRRKTLMAPIAAGMMLIVMVAWNGDRLPSTTELLCSVAGSVLLVSAHLLNRSFCRQCTACVQGNGACVTTTVR